jgi:hypothetical protein
MSVLNLITICFWISKPQNRYKIIGQNLLCLLSFTLVCEELQAFLAGWFKILNVEKAAVHKRVYFGFNENCYMCILQYSFFNVQDRKIMIFMLLDVIYNIIIYMCMLSKIYVCSDIFLSLHVYLFSVESFLAS